MEKFEYAELSGFQVMGKKGIIGPIIDVFTLTDADSEKLMNEGTAIEILNVLGASGWFVYNSSAELAPRPSPTPQTMAKLESREGWRGTSTIKLTSNRSLCRRVC